MPAQALTKTNETIEKVIEMAAKTPYFLEPNLDWRRLVKEIEPLKAQRRYEWDGAMGVLYSYVMKFEEAEACFENSLKLNEDPVTIFNYFHCMLYGGHYRKAQQMYQKYGDPSRGLFTKLAPIAHECGAFETYVKYGVSAKNMNLDINIDILSAVVRLMADAGIGQEEVAHHMEVAAEILKRHKLRPRMKRVFAGDKDGGSMFSVLFVVPMTTDSVFDLNVELAQAEDAHGIKKQIAFDVAFVPQLESDTVPIDEALSL